jgi:8'-apo-carotenoid 13,14-cleaving dioxygenase
MDITSAGFVEPPEKRSSTVSTYLETNFAPVKGEVTAFDLPVIGEIPKDLEGRYLRNGPNPIAEVDPRTHHWFLGDGMVHGIRLRGGKAEWYRNRYVGSDAVAENFGRPITGPNWSESPTGPNTNVGGFAGKTWAMVEAGGTPVELSYELETVARNDFEGTLPGAFTAHPKVDPDSGELHAVAYAPSKWFDHVQYVVVGTDGRVRRTVDVPMGMSMVHDMSLTRKYAVVFDFPVTVDLDEAFAGVAFPLRWNPDYGSRVGLLPREGEAKDIVWVDAPVCYAFHPLNAYDRPDGSVVIDLCVYDRMFATDRLGPFGDSLPRLERWEIDPVAGRTSTTVIDATAQEFPRHAHSVGTREHRYGYSAAVNDLGNGNFGLGGTLKHDLRTGERTSFDYGPGRGAGEPVFVARQGSTGEDDGWLITFTHANDGTDAGFVVLDAQDVARGPVAEVKLPQRVPFGFHGNWVSDRSVPPPV